MNGFYSSLAQDYDRMTRFAERSSTEGSVLRNWADPAAVKSALDAACGTGLHAILLSKMGIAATGADLSPAMLAKARANAADAQAEVRWVESSMESLAQAVKPGFDAVFCLGNSLPHLLTRESLDAFLAAGHALLNPGGFLLIQNLNYDRILEKRERLVGISRQEGREYVRFYDFTGNTLVFNVLVIEENQGRLNSRFESTELYPYREAELREALSRAGFASVESFGSMDAQEYSKAGSANLVLRVRKH